MMPWIRYFEKIELSVLKVLYRLTKPHPAVYSPTVLSITFCAPGHYPPDVGESDGGMGLGSDSIFLQDRNASSKSLPERAIVQLTDRRHAVPPAITAAFNST